MKGIFSSISVAMLLITLFSLSSLIVYTQMKTKENISPLLAADRIYHRFRDVENGFKEIFNKVGGINISVSANSVTFEENLPGSQYFFNDMQAFKQFVESVNDLQVRVDLSKVIPKLPLTITPFNILYQHLNYGDKSYEIVPLYFENVTGYDVFMDVGNYGVTSIKWSSDCSKTKTCSGNLKFHVIVLGRPGGSVQTWENAQNLDPTKTNRLEMSLVASGGLKGNILIHIANPAKFNISSDTPIFIRTRVDLQQTNEKIHVKYPPNILLVNSSVFESWKNNTVVIA